MSEAADIRIIRGDASEEELAGLTAVVGDAYAREAAAAVVEDKPVSAWQQTRRSLRRPVRRDIPWGRFSG